MGMMGMGWMMVLGIVLAVIVILLVIAAISRVAGGRLSHRPPDDAAEKPKRDRLMLTDDGELLEIVDSDWDDDEKSIERELPDALDHDLWLEDEHLTEASEVERKSRE
jgi:uncharacterized membrane protein